MLLHDVASCAHEWDEVARPLAETFRVLALDLRGHGESTHSSRTTHYLLLTTDKPTASTCFLLLSTHYAGESTHSSRSEYGLEHLVGDVHELVVRLSLNGRAWGGEFTRPWVLAGRGMGAAVGVAYAAQHKGRVGGLVLWDYDPEWPKDRLNMYPYQAAEFPCQEACAAMLNGAMKLEP